MRWNQPRPFFTTKASIPLLALILCSQSIGSYQRFTLEETIFHEVAEEENIDPLLLYAVAITESASSKGGGYIAPSPYVFRTKQGPRFFETRPEAEAALREALKISRNIDIGMMQINFHYHPHHNPMDLLDPYHNLKAAAKYLKNTMSTTDDPILGVGRYHSWTEERSRWYGERVWQIYRNLLQITAFD